MNGDRVSAKNCAITYDQALSLRQQQDAHEHGWRFGMKLTTEHVWDAFVVYSLLRDCDRRQQLLRVPHTGDQRNRFTSAMQERNHRIQVYGQPSLSHYCDGCTRFYDRRDAGEGVRKFLFSI